MLVYVVTYSPKPGQLVSVAYSDLEAARGCVRELGRDGIKIVSAVHPVLLT